MTRPLCIYHKNCPDGFAAAWAVRKRHGGAVDFHAASYGEAAPAVAGRKVIIVDFSYKRDVLTQMLDVADYVVLIDHHASTKRELAGLARRNFAHVINSKHCGAMLTWRWLFEDHMPPLLFDHINDNDLWKFEKPMTREIMATVFSYRYDFVEWDALMARPLLDLEREGRVLLRQRQKDIDDLIAEHRRTMRFGSLEIPVANVPHKYASDVAGRLAEGHPFAAAYSDDATGRRWSLRSARTGADVSIIAEALGGGGHKHAAGFRQTREEAIDFELSGGNL